MGPCNSYLEGPTLISGPAARALFDGSLRSRRIAPRRAIRFESSLLLTTKSRDLPTRTAGCGPHVTWLNANSTPRQSALRVTALEWQEAVLDGEDA